VFAQEFDRVSADYAAHRVEIAAQLVVIMEGEWDRQVREQNVHVVSTAVQSHSGHSFCAWYWSLLRLTRLPFPLAHSLALARQLHNHRKAERMNWAQMSVTTGAKTIAANTKQMHKVLKTVRTRPKPVHLVGILFCWWRSAVMFRISGGLCDRSAAPEMWPIVTLRGHV
jgi:hypothetical protein